MKIDKNRTDIEEIKSLIKELYHTSNEQIIININIESLTIDTKDLEDLPLHFHFDKVDVKENKGSINFGNTMLEKEEGKAAVPLKKEKMKDKKEESLVIKVNNRNIEDYYMSGENRA